MHSCPDQLTGYLIACNSMPTSILEFSVVSLGAQLEIPVTTKTFLDITSTVLDSEYAQIAILLFGTSKA